jgi:SAM-dependent methyltransferase
VHLKSSAESNQRVTRYVATMPEDSTAVERWSEGLETELAFWYRWLRDKGEPWPDDYRLRMDPRAELQSHLREHIDARAGARVRILDVGSGPLTRVGKRWRGRRLSVTAVDPLADRYRELLERLSLRPEGIPLQGEAERLDELLPADSFDLAWACNSLDHGHDPLRAIRQMLRLVKPGRRVLLDHVVNEGENMGYAGLHQWNFRAEDGRFVIWRPGETIDAHGELRPQAEIDTEPLEDGKWLRVVLRRR